MSTYIYLVCEDHDPPLVSDDESGQHRYDLPEIRQDIADRDALVRLVERDAIQTGWRSASARFLAAHRKCHIGIIDEYGNRHPVATEVPDGE